MNTPEDLDELINDDTRTLVHYDDEFPAKAPLKHKKLHVHLNVVRERCRESDLQDLPSILSSAANLLDGCNTPPLMAQETTSFGCFQAAASADPCAHAYASNSAMCYYTPEYSESQQPYPATCRGSRVLPRDPQYKKLNDEVLDRLLQCRFDEGDMKDMLPSAADLLDGCNSQLHTASLSCAAAAADSCPNVMMRYSEKQRPYPALRRDSSLPRDSRFGLSTPSPPHTFGSLSLSDRDAETQRHLVEERDRFRDRQLLAEVRASTLLREFSSLKAELAEVGYTDCDLSYLVNMNFF